MPEEPLNDRFRTAEDVLYAHLEYLRARVDEHRKELHRVPRDSEMSRVIRWNMDGFQMAMWSLEDSLRAAGLPLEGGSV